MDLFSLNNKIILITRSTGYFGKIFYNELSKLNVTLILHGINYEKLIQLKKR